MASHGRAEHRARKKHRARLAGLAAEAERRKVTERHRRDAYRYGSCEKKHRYQTKTIAESSRDRFSARTGTPLRVYGPCEFCRGYHLTKQEEAR